MNKTAVEIYQWLRMRPTPEEISEAVSEIQGAYVISAQQGFPPTEATIKTLAWLFATQRTPIEYVEQILVMPEFRNDR